MSIPSKNIIIKKATAEDIPVIQKITYQTWPVTYGNIVSQKQLSYMVELIYCDAALKRQMEEEQQQFVIAYENDVALAFASFGKIENPIYKLHKIYALPNQQGKGLGKILIDYVINEIKKLNAAALRLNVNRHNKAKDFYTHLGFSVIYEEDVDIGNGYFMNDYVMEKKLR